MSEIYNLIKNNLDNHIRKYDKKNLFTLSLINNLEKIYAVKYITKYKGVDFSIEVEYIDEKIIFATFIGESHSSEASLEITDFMKFILIMLKEDLTRQIQFALSR
ncbi:hypothetical protein [Flavobacterium sp. UBA7680]|uniref:hypothetical protein n=1 Tax=Flavobacterium sp. UBA7680 TaxID=1946559 RepID=UPI0025BC53EF|nr:hypothetical protein [Flavobacterium sp. UBA7680]